MKIILGQVHVANSLKWDRENLQWEFHNQQTLVIHSVMVTLQMCEAISEDCTDWGCASLLHHNDISFSFYFSTGCEIPSTEKWPHLTLSSSRIPIGCSVAFRLVIALIFPHQLGTWTAQLHLRAEMKQLHVSIVSRQEVLHWLPFPPYLYGARPVLLINTSLSTLRSA